MYRKPRNLYMRNRVSGGKNTLNKHPLQRRGRRTNDTIVSAVINTIQ